MLLATEQVTPLVGTFLVNLRHTAFAAYLKIFNIFLPRTRQLLPRLIHLDPRPPLGAAYRRIEPTAAREPTGPTPES